MHNLLQAVDVDDALIVKLGSQGGRKANDVESFRFFINGSEVTPEQEVFFASAEAEDRSTRVRINYL